MNELVWTFNKDIINEAIAKTIKQNMASFSTVNSCAYENTAGLRCIVGHMMPAHILEKYSQSPLGIRALLLEMKSQETVTINNETDLSTPMLFELLVALQNVHDKKIVLVWPEEFKPVQKEFSLI